MEEQVAKPKWSHLRIERSTVAPKIPKHEFSRLPQCICEISPSTFSRLPIVHPRFIAKYSFTVSKPFQEMQIPSCECPWSRYDASEKGCVRGYYMLKLSLFKSFKETLLTDCCPTPLSMQSQVYYCTEMPFLFYTGMLLPQHRTEFIDGGIGRELNKVRFGSVWRICWI